MDFGKFVLKERKTKIGTKLSVRDIHVAELMDLLASLVTFLEIKNFDLCTFKSNPEQEKKPVRTFIRFVTWIG